MKESDSICIFIQGDAALFPNMAMANHLCQPNAEFIDRTDIGLQLLVVIYVIEAGDEICINYMPMEDEGCDNRAGRSDRNTSGDTTGSSAAVRPALYRFGRTLLKQ